MENKRERRNKEIKHYLIGNNFHRDKGKIHAIMTVI
jgi:hypothetical protein